MSRAIFFLSLLVCCIQWELSARESAEYYVNKTYVLKSQPFKTDKIEIFRVDSGDRVKLLSLEENTENPEDEWAKVGLANGMEGFIPFSHLQKDKPPAHLRSRNLVVFEPKTYYVRVGSLLLRDGPGQNFNSVSSLDRNQEVKVVKFSDNDDFIDGYAARWAFVKVGSYLEGWVYSAYLSLQQSQSGEEEPWDHILSGNTKFVRPPILRVRDEPGKMGNIIATIPQGASVRILERKSWTEQIVGLRSVWVRIQFENREGFVFGGFLSSRPGLSLNSDDIDKPFISPVAPAFARINSRWGYRNDPINNTRRLHGGVDMPLPIGTPIFAVGDGNVIFVHDYGNVGLGRYIVVQHSNGLVSCYAHLDKFLVKVGERVKAGDRIALSGNTGRSTGPHLHYEIRIGLHQTTLDPEIYTVIP